MKTKDVTKLIDQISQLYIEQKIILEEARTVQQENTTMPRTTNKHHWSTSPAVPTGLRDCNGSVLNYNEKVRKTNRKKLTERMGKIIKINHITQRVTVLLAAGDKITRISTNVEKRT